MSTLDAAAEREIERRLPAPTALAATWDLTVVARAGEVFAAEARRKGVDV